MESSRMMPSADARLSSSEPLRNCPNSSSTWRWSRVSSSIASIGASRGRVEILIEIISVSTPLHPSVREVVEETAMSDVDQLTVDPTIEVEEGLTPTETRLCPGCGKPEALWRANLGRGLLDD